MKAERKKQVDYLPYMDDKLRISHTSRADSPLKPVPDKDTVDLSDGVVRSNLRKQIRVRKKVLAGIHCEIRELEGMLDE